MGLDEAEKKGRLRKRKGAGGAEQQSAKPRERRPHQDAEKDVGARIRNNLRRSNIREAPVGDRPQAARTRPKLAASQRRESVHAALSLERP